MSKYVLVTGASTGIGRDGAVTLAKNGFHVFAGVRNEKAAQAIRDEEIATLEPIEIDVTKQESVDACVKTLSEKTGEAGLYGLVNNAGIAVPGPLEYLPLDEFEWQMEVNVTGQVRVTQAMLPLLRQTRGRIVITGSTSGYFSPPFMGPYCASKFAMEAFADCLRRELRPWGMQVALLQPGAIKTPIWEKSESEGDKMLERLPPQAMEFYGEKIDKLRGMAAMQRERAVPVERCSKAILHALTASRPRTRYKIGADAWVQIVIQRVLPDRVLDWIFSKMF